MPQIYIIVLVVYFSAVFFGRIFNPNLRRLQRKIPMLLLEYSVYYQNLNFRERKNFEKRVFRFITIKHFYRFDNSEATDEMKILIAATAIQITFGFSDGYEYEVFRRIAISDKDYVSRQTRKVHQGEANQGKSLIAFSWEKFMEGVKNPHDSVNLGLHEFAHALFINNVRGYCNRPFQEIIGAWHKNSYKTCPRAKNTRFFPSLCVYQ